MPFTRAVAPVLPSKMRLFWVVITAVIRGNMAFPAPENLSKSLPFRDADDDLCPDNLSFIKRLAAVGDSYSTPPARPIKPVDQLVLRYKHTQPSRQVQEDTELRILPIGDSITVGFLSDTHGGDGDGYRRELKKDLSSKHHS
jgi:hypothetical protein